MAASNRRLFLQGLGTAVGMLPGLRASGSLHGVRSSVLLAGADEPGERLVVSGAVLDAGGAPRPGVTLRVYHTDSEGYYSRPESDPRRARLKGSARTDDAGRYELRTILPGHYPGSRIERHIHVHVVADGLPEHWIDSFLFEGDPYVRPEVASRSAAAGRFGHVMAQRRENGAILCRRDIRLDPALAERNRLVNGWYRQ